MSIRRIGMDARYGLMAERRGIGVYIYSVLTEWRRMPPPNWEFVLFADNRADPDVVRQFSRPPFTVEILPAPSFAWFEQWSLPRAIRRHRLDVFHAAANVGPLFPGTALVVTMFDVIEWHRGRDFPGRLSWRHRLSRMYRMNAMRVNARMARRILTISEHARTDIMRTLGVHPERIVSIPLGHTERRAASAADAVLAQHGLRPKEYVMAFGALDQRKNSEMLAQVWEDMPLPLVLAGFEPAALARYQHRYGRNPQLRLLGFQTDEAIAVLMANARLFLYPSFYEGFGLPVVEAMAAGTPVVVASGTAAAEVADTAGAYVSPYRPEAWSRAVRDLLADPDRLAAMREEGLRVVRRYSWAKTAQGVVEAYRRVLADAAISGRPDRGPISTE